MSIVRMKRLRVIALEEQRDALLARMQRLGCVEISEPDDKLADPDWMALLSRGSSNLGDVKAEQTAVNTALATLKKYAPVKGGLFRIRSTISEAELFSQQKKEEIFKGVQEVNSAAAEIGQLTTQAARLSAQRDGLKPWAALDMPLELEGTDSTEVVMGTIPAAEDLAAVKGALAEGAPLCELMEISADAEMHYVLLICHKSQWADAQNALKPYTFSAARFKESAGTAAENIKALEAQLAETGKRRSELEAEIVAHKGLHSDLELMIDRLTQDAQREAAREKGLTNGTIIFLEGWVAEPKLEKLKAVLESFDAAYFFRDPEEGDDVPTLLDNPGWMKPMNMVTEMYSPPAYDGIDPNPLIFGWYIFFFGFMFADVAYGIIIALVSHIIIKKYNPKGYLFTLGRYLGISTAICGFFVGGFFGDSITTFAETFLNIPVDQLPGWLQTFCNGIVVNPVNDPMTVLIIALAIGIVQLVVGQCIHIYMEARDGHPMEGILDVVPWWIFLGGIPVMMLLGSSVMIIVGVIALVLTQGRHNKGLFGKAFGGVASLYDVTSWLSDILSYARLMALMLATSVIAMVFNTLAAMPKNIIFFIIVFAIGHIFNIGVNLIGTYVHAARLQYLEFYGKFYKDGGRFFKPLNYTTKFVDIDEEEN